MAKKADIHTSHYTSEIIGSLVTQTMWRGSTIPQDTIGMLSLVRLLRESTKFSLGNLQEDEYSDYHGMSEITPDHLYLPYEIVALEFSVPYLDGYDRETYMPTVLVLAQLSIDHPAIKGAAHHFDLKPEYADMDKQGFMFLTFSYFEGAWMMHNIAGALVPPALIKWDKASKMKNRVSHKPEAVLMEAVVLDPDDIPVGETAREFIANWCKQISMELRTLANFLFRLHQKKARVQVFAAPAKLNRKRIKRGKEPFYEYRILTVDPDAPNVEIINPVKRHHKSPKLHVRRGHWRQYRSGKKVWVEQMLVGDPDKGVVIKDYEVK